MKLLTKELRKKLPPLGATANEQDPMVICKFFFPDFHWTWYAIEFDAEDIFFGYVVGDFPELGYFSLSELTSTWGKLGFPVSGICTSSLIDFRPCRKASEKEYVERSR
jgi:hypothetical protein